MSEKKDEVAECKGREHCAEYDIPVARQTGTELLARLMPEPGASLIDCPTSLDLDSQAGRELAFNATSQQTLELSAEGEIVMTCEHYVIHPAQAKDPETGELKDVLRAVFITPEGETYATTSEVVVKRLAQMLSLFDGAHFDRPVRIRITERKARRSGREYHDLRFATGVEEQS